MDDKHLHELVAELEQELQEIRGESPARPTRPSVFNVDKHALDPGSVSALFDPRMAFELALGVFDPIDIAMRYQMTQEEFQLVTESPAFQNMLMAYHGEIQAKGISTKLKAKIQLDHLLGVAFDMATDPRVPAGVRADLIKWHAELADEMPRKQAPVLEAPSGHQFTYALHIVMSGEKSHGTIIEAESRVVESKVIEEEDSKDPLVIPLEFKAAVPAAAPPAAEANKNFRVADDSFDIAAAKVTPHGGNRVG